MYFFNELLSKCDNVQRASRYLNSLFTIMSSWLFISDFRNTQSLISTNMVITTNQKSDMVTHYCILFKSLYQTQSVMYMLFLIWAVNSASLYITVKHEV